MRDRVERHLARLIPLRPWLALGHLLVGVAITIPAFILHDLTLAVVGAVFLGGALGVLLVPLPYSR